MALLRKKGDIATGEMEILVGSLKALGRLDELDGAGMSKEGRARLAQILVETGEEPRALDLLLKAGELEREGFAVALRVCMRLNDWNRARGFYIELQDCVALKEAPELYYQYALLCEKCGRVAEAAEVYGKIIKRFPGFKDIPRRLEELKSLSQADRARLTMTVAPASSAAPTGETAPGLIGGRFEVRRPLGRGAMGVVFLAVDGVLSREVAVKRISGRLSGDPRARERFLNEARLVASLDHPYIVPIHDIVISGEEAFLILEYLNGETLAEILASRGRLQPKECVRMLSFVCEAMAYAHGKGVVHRDLKPSNVMMNRQGYVKVMDFGIAISGAGSHGPAGTPAFMAPEQHEGSATAASDVFAMGATAYELLTGNLPFTGADLAECKKRAVFEPLPPESPEPLRRLVADCLAPDPGARPAMRAAGARLRELLPAPAGR